jgi:hypothetical protein
MYGGEYGSSVSRVEEALHAYPGDLTRFVRGSWEDTPAKTAWAMEPTLESPELDEAVLGALLSGCYQASLLREEEREVSFRAVLAEPALFEPDGGPPDGFHRLEFPDTRPFSARVLRRLSVAADFHRSLIGVCLDADGELRIWGLLQSGSRWLRDARGGRRAGAALPPVPVVHVIAPGSIEARKGYELVGKLEAGKLTGSRVDLFDSEWIQAEFSGLRGELVALHEEAREQARHSGEVWPALEPDLDRKISERKLKRTISVVRDSHHGGTLVFVPPDMKGRLCGENPYLEVKYPFVESQPRVRFKDLTVGLMNRMARIHAPDDPTPVRWEEFETTTDGEIATLDEALFEMAYLIAGLAAADGAVVMDKQHELLGFGAEISGHLPEVRTAWKALDLEGNELREAAAEDVGTRHRSAYRLAGALPGVLLVVVSQDGDVRFVSSREGRVIYWEQ